MRIIIYITSVLLFLSCNIETDNHNESQKKVSNTDTKQETTTVYNIGFYNVENLFDTLDDPNTEDEWFLPSSETHWNDEKYNTKLKNLAKVIDVMSISDGGPDLMGLCEVENKNVVMDLASENVLNANQYEVVHFESPDTRGIDVAAMYNPAKFQLLESRSIEVNMPEDPAIKTRDILYCQFEVILSGEIIHFYVNHWSSRRGGEEETFFKRKNCALALLHDIESNIGNYESQNIIIVGDMNDYPINKSLTDILGAGKPETDATFWNIQFVNHGKGLGTYNYKGEWGCLDNIVVSPNTYNKLITKHAIILKEQWMLFTDSDGIQYPDKSYGGTNYYGGYSDHLPVYFEILL